MKKYVVSLLKSQTPAIRGTVLTYNIKIGVCLSYSSLFREERGLTKEQMALSRIVKWVRPLSGDKEAMTETNGLYPSLLS